ncbi:MAG: ATP-dependent helicase, partial [Bacteroidota bacterium]
GYTSNFSIYDADDSLSLIRKIMNRSGISNQQFPAQGIRARISNAKNQMRSPEMIRTYAERTLDKVTADIYEEYERTLINNNAMDFDDLLLNFIRLLDKDRETLKKYQEKFKYILVDEYQDTNRAQYIAVNQLAKAHSNLCVVGDDAQSIYRWRGADIRNILDFQKDYPHAKVIRLEQNYRSTKVILAAADCIIQKNRKQIPKKLWTDNLQGEPISLIDCTDDRAEAAKVAEIITKEKMKNKGYKDFAVLYRTNAQSLALENSLRMNAIPYVIIGGTSFYKRKEIKDVIAYLRILVNPKDSESLMRIINEPPRGLGQTSLRHIEDFAQKQGVSVLKAALYSERIDKLQKRAVNAAKKFAEMLKKYIEERDSSDPFELINNYIHDTNILQMYKEINTEDSLDRWNNIQQLLSDIKMFFKNEDNASLEDYLQQISLVSDIDETDISQDKVTLMTMHAAKGLEFPVVIITGMEKGLFPLARAEQMPEEAEEERRLFYVGITRAEEKLYLTYAERRMRFGETTYQLPSAFIGEIDKKLIDRRGHSGSIQDRKASVSYRPAAPKRQTPQFDDMQYEDNYSQLPQAEHEIRVGDNVRHNTFGIGKITGLSGEGKNRQAVVNFNSVGRKKLMLEYAKLQKV